MARDPFLSASPKRTRIAQTCWGFIGAMWPTSLLLFQGIHCPEGLYNGIDLLHS